MKKYIFFGVCFFANALFGGLAAQVDFKALFKSPKGQKLNQKVFQFYVSHPKTAEYFYEGGKSLKEILETYCEATQKLIDVYPQAYASKVAEKRVENIRYYLSHSETLTKLGLFLALGIYSLNDYQDPKSWKQLLQTQEAILTHYIKRGEIKADLKACESAWSRGGCPLEELEKELMQSIKAFCLKSADPFFKTTVYGVIKDCNVREDILKYLLPLRDETMPVSGEIITEAEEAFAALNEDIWLRLRAEIKRFFDRPETLERFIEITSDTFDIPNYKQG
ncbi:MAG: hypothetical protein KDK64_00595 [Chlamydiia bacterium]|nr:hypothetical protein [Chlamydiia bacterium]